MKYEANKAKKWLHAFGVIHLLEENQQGEDIQTKTRDAKQSQETQCNYKYSTLEELRNAVMHLDHPLKNTCKNTVFSSGPQDARLMIIGEAPGADEDEQGVPFVGESGKLVNNILRSINIARDEVYVANVIFWRPPKNRPPLPDEVEFCRPYFTEHIRLINPKVILLLGAVATKAILQKTSGITSLRGEAHKIGETYVIPTFHPSYLLRSPTKKYEAMLDFNLAVQYLKKI